MTVLFVTCTCFMLACYGNRYYETPCMTVLNKQWIIWKFKNKTITLTTSWP